MNFSGEARKHEVKEFDTDSSEGSRALKDDFSRVIGEKKNEKSSCQPLISGKKVIKKRLSKTKFLKF